MSGRELHLDGAHVIREDEDGSWKHGANMTRAQAEELVEKHLEFTERRAATLREILEDWDMDHDPYAKPEKTT